MRSFIFLRIMNNSSFYGGEKRIEKFRITPLFMAEKRELKNFE